MSCESDLLPFLLNYVLTFAVVAVKTNSVMPVAQGGRAVAVNFTVTSAMLRTTLVAITVESISISHICDK